MQVLFRTEPEPDQGILEQLEDRQRLKFVAFGQKDNGVISLFPMTFQHSGFIAHIRGKVERLQFKGAGLIDPRNAFKPEGFPVSVAWGSESCEREFGYDRPQEEEAARRIEREICDRLRSVINDILQKRMSSNG